MENIYNKPIGLVLGGGAILGAAHIGVLRYLEEKEVEINCIAGTSIGAIIGAMVAFGKTSKEIAEIVEGVKWLDVSRPTLSKDGILSQKKLAAFMKDVIGDVDFKDAKIPLSVVATDIATGEKVVISEGSVIQAILASSAIPGVFLPVKMGDRLLVDGGVVENVPVSVLRDHDVEHIFAVSLNAVNNEPKNMIDVIINAFQFMSFQTTKLQLEESDVLLNMELTDYNMVSTSQVPELIQVGYEQAKEHMENLN